MLFAMLEEQIFMSLSFFLQKVISELNCTKSFFIASKNTNSVLVQMMRLRRHGCSKTSPSVRKKLLNAILRVKAQNMKTFLSNEMKCFVAMQKTDFHEFEVLAEKSHFRA